MTKKVRLRYAPSPTGFLHIGNARTAIFCYLWAKHYNGDFIVRIEDTDLERNVEGGIESQIHWLKWLGVTPDESIYNEGNFGPYQQTKRLDIYKKYVEDLLESKHAYYSFESSEQIDAKREAVMSQNKAYIHRGSEREMDLEEARKLAATGVDYSIRFKVQDNEFFNFNDIVRGEIKTQGKDISDFVIMKNNGIPTYNFACVVDDYLMEISHVLRGEEHISNTPKQLMIYKALNFEAPKFAHASLIVNEQRKKLSKRDNDVVQFVEQYEKLGFLPESILNFISLLGWTPSTNDEIFTKEQLIEIFDENRLVKSPSFFDVKKLRWINEQHIKSLSTENYLKFVKRFVQESNLDLSSYSKEWINEALLLFQDAISQGNEIVDQLKSLIEKPQMDKETEDFYNLETSQITVKAFEEIIKNVDISDITNIKAAIKEVQKITGNKGKNLFMPIRIFISNQMHGPELPILIKLAYSK